MSDKTNNECRPLSLRNTTRAHHQPGVGQVTGVCPNHKANRNQPARQLSSTSDVVETDMDDNDHDNTLSSSILLQPSRSRTDDVPHSFRVASL